MTCSLASPAGILASALSSILGRASLEAESFEGGGEGDALQIEADLLARARSGDEDLAGEEAIEARGELGQRESLDGDVDLAPEAQGQADPTRVAIVAFACAGVLLVHVDTATPSSGALDLAFAGRAVSHPFSFLARVSIDCSAHFVGRRSEAKEREIQ